MNLFKLQVVQEDMYNVAKQVIEHLEAEPNYDKVQVKAWVNSLLDSLWWQLESDLNATAAA